MQGFSCVPDMHFSGVMFVAPGEQLQEEQFKKLIRIPTSMQTNQRLLPVENFPEEILARRNDPVLTDFLRIKPKSSVNRNSENRENILRSFP